MTDVKQSFPRQHPTEGVWAIVDYDADVEPATLDDLIALLPKLEPEQHREMRHALMVLEDRMHSEEKRALEEERDAAIKRAETWQNECVRLATGIIETFEKYDNDEYGNDDDGCIPPERAVDTAFQVFDDLRAETEKLRGELAQEIRAHANTLDALATAREQRDDAERRESTIAEKTARERAVIDAAIAWNAAGNEHPGLGKTALALLKAIDALVTDAPSKPEDKPWGTASRKGLHAKSPQEEDIESMQHIRGGLDAVIFEQNGHRWASDGVPKRFLCMNPGCAEKWVAEPPTRPMPLCAYSDPAPPPPESPAEPTTKPLRRKVSFQEAIGAVAASLPTEEEPRLRPCDSPNCGGHHE